MSNFKNYMLNDEQYEEMSHHLGEFKQIDIPKGLYSLKIISAKYCDPQYGEGINLQLTIQDGILSGTTFFHTIYKKDKEEAEALKMPTNTDEEMEARKKLLTAALIPRHNFNALVRVLGNSFNDPADFNGLCFKGYVSTWKNPTTGKFKYNLNVNKEKTNVDTCPLVMSQPVKEEENYDDIPF
jgi:hypothetical protein